ncbi:tyrosine-protein phosphatase [Demequina sp. SO4-13]|uniref:tyrosine-protein phosphatase n=1 Tax=Demequina sp. SO4-13 TaxID=3401027 RepID=UPI003AF77D43
MGHASHRLANVRDLADASPGLVRDVVYRSDAPMPGDSPPEGVVTWPPATVIDLRGPAEKGDAHPLEDGATVVELDLLAAAAFTDGEARGPLRSLADLYAVMIAPVAAATLTSVVREVARGPAPVLVHCTAGKDRTGVSVALVLRLLEVERSRVVADYTLTQDHMPGVLARMLASSRTSVGDTPLVAVPKEVLSAPMSAIETVLDEWDAYRGGVEGWYLAHGGDAETLAELRRRLRA